MGKIRCQLCTISVDNEFKPCWRDGNEADILFIGEAPGHIENKLKVPFVGKAGIKLREFVKYYHLDNLSSFTNIIKCKPPHNRDPFQYEIKNCKPFLLQDITEVQPKIIVLLGRIAIESFTNVPIEFLKTVVNKPFSIGSIIVLPMYHPSYILRNNTDHKYFESFNILSDIYSNVNKYYNKRNFKPKV